MIKTAIGQQTMEIRVLLEQKLMFSNISLNTDYIPESKCENLLKTTSSK